MAHSLESAIRQFSQVLNKQLIFHFKHCKQLIFKRKSIWFIFYASQNGISDISFCHCHVCVPCNFNAPENKYVYCFSAKKRVNDTQTNGNYVVRQWVCGMEWRHKSNRNIASIAIVVELVVFPIRVEKSIILYTKTQTNGEKVYLLRVYSPSSEKETEIRLQFSIQFVLNGEDKECGGCVLFSHLLHSHQWWIGTFLAHNIIIHSVGNGGKSSFTT